MRSLRSRSAGEAWLGAGVLAAVILAAALRDPTRPGRFPTCPFHAVTGLDCPGCGSLRALYELAHGHVVAALDHNAFLVVFLPFGALAWLRALTGSRSPSRTLPGWALLALVVAWGVIRNLPVFGGVLAA